MIDLDHFKQLNDTHGHVAGDQALVDAARAWQGQLRGGDVLARLGGDEFAVLLPDCESQHVDGIVRRLKPSRPGAHGCSIGVAVRRPGEDAAALTRRADRALYEDKANAAT